VACGLNVLYAVLANIESILTIALDSTSLLATSFPPLLINIVSVLYYTDMFGCEAVINIFLLQGLHPFIDSLRLWTDDLNLSGR
jgi:hypothetical protein